MRDMRKDKEYFEKYLEYQYSRIEKKMAKLKDADEEKKQRILVSLVGYELDLLKAEFSVGTTKDNIKTLLNRAIKIAGEYKNITYEDLLNLLSLAVLVNDKSEAGKLVKLHYDKIEKDRLLKFLALYINGEKPVWNEDIPLAGEFIKLNKVFTEKSKEAGMRDYLNEWYENHSGYGWYNSHLGTSDTYCGYWSFESAAVAIILGLDENELKQSEYYPYF